MVFGTIYLLTNIVNSKKYVGQTTSMVRRRWLLHCVASAQRRSNDKAVLHKAINKYGKESFVISELQQADSRSHLDSLEQDWIQRLNTKIPNGYNMTDGGGGISGFKMKSLSPEGRKKISLANTGRLHSEASKSRISLGKKGKPLSEAHKQAIGRGNKGKIFSSERRRRISEAKRGKSFSDENLNNMRRRTSRLVEKDVEKIFLDGRSRQKIANEYGISTSAVSNIKHSFSWKDVTEKLKVRKIEQTN